MKARPLQALIPSGRVSSAAAVATALCQQSAPPCWASWAAWPGMSLPGPRGLPSVLTSVQGGPPMFANVLTHGPRLRHSGFPQITQGMTNAFPASQEPGKSLSQHIRHLPSKYLPGVCLAGCFRILAGCNVRMSARLRRLCVSRGALRPAFFFYPKSHEAFMNPITTAALRPVVLALSCNLIPAGEVRHGHA